MLCEMCGRDMGIAEANYCSYCGHSFREEAHIVPKQNCLQEEMPTGFQNPSKEAMGKSEQSVSFRNWFGTMMLPFIPIVGIFIYFSMLFVWAFGSTTITSKKNWARVQLLVLLLSILLVAAALGSVTMDEWNMLMSLYS